MNRKRRRALKQIVFHVVWFCALFHRCQAQPSDVFFVAPRPGSLAIMPNFAQTWHDSLPDTAHLAIRLFDITYTPRILPYLPCQSTALDLRDSCGWQWQSARWYRYQLCGVTPTDTFYTRHVQTGDTVRFALYGRLYNPTETLFPAGDNLWFVRMVTPRPSGCVGKYEPRELCIIYFSFADTLVTFMTPDTGVYPTYQGHNQTPATRNYIDLELRVTLADSAIGNYFVQVQQPVLVDSGGHSHDANRPMGRYLYPIGSTDTVQIITAQTDSLGRLMFRYVASQFGGVERIRARLVSDTTNFDTLRLSTRVPGLQLLADGTNYVKVGGTCRHHGPSTTEPTACRTPDNDHWATTGMIQTINTIADSFATYYSDFKIRVNDISLPRGGGFDVGGNWEDDIIDKFASRDTCNLVGHCEHREGNIADISFLVRDRLGRDMQMTPEQRERMWGILRYVVGSPSEHGHYHIRRR